MPASEVREAVERFGEWLSERESAAVEMIDLLTEGGHSTEYDHGRLHMARDATREVQVLLAAVEDES